ncbi:inovirus-type Gp2 protein [Burkholderia vietnamiensis]|uniref:inovirus-type Gp2 protein n=1 Tax=Burkholderia vietnamiensis TaxID=60552 RepID=UPI001B99B6B6|nr:inovirus-type Gp2 protein [Burkholderia vietnamiensis]MBR8218426.1 inovirus-type Gp2 protein [Burkholderia vietnamiensis]MCA8181216.1 inovirus-type Gp2 protein [Burkholderia vietnamiensis]
MSFEEDDVKKIYEYSDLVRNTERAEIAGEEKIVLLPSLDLLRTSLASMEALVRDIEFSKDGVGFEIGPSKWGKPVVVPKPLGKRYFYALKAFFQNYAYAERYVYSTHVSAVPEAFDALGLHPLAFTFREPGSIERSTGKTHGETFNEVVKKVAEIVDSKQFRERLRVRRRNAERNEAKGLAIEQQVFENKARQLVLVLHFGYQEQYRWKLTLDEIQAHRKKFFNNCRTNKLLRGIVDYIWKLEDGDESGLHLHVLIFYTADSCRDVYIAKQLGEYWVKVTGDKGQYWNSNANKLFHEKHGHGVGTGEINWDDHEKREALRMNIRYMTKADQFLKMKYGEHCRVFGTSQVKEKEKLGRPRTVKPKSDGDPSGSTQVDSFDSESLEETGTDARNPDAGQSE